MIEAMLSKLVGSFIFNFISFLIVCTLFMIAKDFWKNKKFLKSIALFVVTIVVACAFLIYKGHSANERMSENKKETPQNLTTNDSSEQRNFEKNFHVDENKKVKTLGDTAVDVPRPLHYVSGMQPIRDGEGFYIEFDKSFSNEEYGFICDYADSKYETELRIAKTEVPTADLKATFDSLTEIQRKEIIDSIKKANIAQSANFGSTITFLDDGYFRVNGNIVLWVKAVIKNNDLMSQTTFCYYVAKNKKIYSLQYITNSIDDKPNDTILTSLNTLRFE